MSGTYYAWRSLPRGELHAEPLYLVLALGIYVVTYGLHLLGWHSLATFFFGQLPFRENAEAAAASTILKYLPTVVWYIANRVHFYTQHHIPRRAVVAASLSELVVMIASGSLLYTGFWLAHNLLFAIPLGLAGLGLAILSIVLPDRGPHTWWQRWTGLVDQAVGETERKYLLWLSAFIWYGSSWPLGVCFLWAILHVFVPLQIDQLLTLFNIWLLVGLTSYVLSISLGGLGIAREITLTVLLARNWPLAAAVATSIVVKMLLTLGEIGCSALVLGWRSLSRRRAARA